MRGPFEIVSIQRSLVTLYIVNIWKIKKIKSQINTLFLRTYVCLFVFFGHKYDLIGMYSLINMSVYITNPYENRSESK